jgi:hypothetical protein
MSRLLGTTLIVGIAGALVLGSMGDVRAEDPPSGTHWYETFDADCDGWTAGGTYSFSPGQGPYFVEATVYLTTGNFYRETGAVLVETSTDTLLLPKSTVAFQFYPEDLGKAWASAPLDGTYYAHIKEVWYLGTDNTGTYYCTHVMRKGPFDCVAGGCRFTGGGVDTDLNWDHTLEDGSMVRNGAGKLPEGIDRYQFGGQAGASTAIDTNPSGEWTHHQQKGPSGAFTFHGGTSSSPEGSRIVEIRCSDPGHCDPARKAPFKQLDFDGIGTFRSIGKGKSAPTWEIASPNVTAEGKGNKTFDGTYHWFEVNVDDLGEPGGTNTTAPADCPPDGFGEKGSVALADCGCPDFYRITIYDGVDKQTLDSTGPNKTDVLYCVYGYIDGGNLQIHPPTGKDTK